MIEQNRHYDSFRRILARLDEVVRSFLLTQWHETITTAQLATIHREIVDYLGLNELPAIELNPPKHPPKLKIRGLLFRDRKTEAQDSEKPKTKRQKQKRTKEENLKIFERKKLLKLAAE